MKKGKLASAIQSRPLKAAQERIRKLEAMLEEAHDRLKAKAPELKIKAAGRKPKTFQRVIVPDSHGCFIDQAAANAFLSDLEKLNPREVVLLGDHLDCAGWLAKHHPFKTAQEARYSFAEDVDATNQFLDEIQKRVKKADYHYLEGNHEERIESFVVEKTGQHARDAAWLRKIFSPQSVLHLKQRKIRYYRRIERIGNARQRGVLRLGNCAFTHGSSHAKHAAYKHIQNHKCCIVFGHVHRRMQAGSTSIDGEIDAWCPGCLCQFEPVWKRADPTEWSHGYGLQVVHDNGQFLHLNIPIIDGVSLLRGLL